MLNYFSIITLLFLSVQTDAQVKWVNADADFSPLPAGFHVFKSTSTLDDKPFAAFYAIADIKNKRLQFTTDTTLKRRLTPAQFFQKNGQPLLVVNSTFFSFATHQNLNVVIKNKKTVAFNIHTIPLKGKDTFQYRHPYGSALGISKKRKADVAWLYTDSLLKFPYALQQVADAVKDSVSAFPFKNAKLYNAETGYNKVAGIKKRKPVLTKWKMKTAVGGGPVLLQNGQIKITNNEELKFGGKAINDQHPRTVMGYTKDDKLIVMVVQGRSPGISDGASLVQVAALMKNLGCVEALNLDGGGSSCMLINGKQTITPSDKGLQRAIPAVFIIQENGK